MNPFFKKPSLWISIIGFLIFLALGLRFIPLYSLWDDEANTALFAQSVHETGDTLALRGRNVIAYRNGAELNSNQAARYVSPLQYYFLAPFVNENTKEPTPARLPFFCLSLVSLALLYRRTFKLDLSAPLVFLFSSLTLGLGAFFLFSIQCRYYALCFLFSLLLGEIYWFRKIQTRNDFFIFGLTSAFLFISNYLVGVAMVGAILTHAVFYRRDQIKLSFEKTSAFLLPQVLISLPVLWIWNPLGKAVVSLHNTPFDRLILLLRNIRDYNGGHFGSLVLLILGLAFGKGLVQRRFKQYALIFGAYLVFISLFSPQPVRGTGQADIRYLFPLVILGFAWSVDFGAQVLNRSKIAFSMFVFIFAFSSLPYSGRITFPLVNLIREIENPADDPYALVSTWLNQYGKEGATIRSGLDYAVYPLMYSAPQFHYIGQFQAEASIAPDYVISFCDDSITGSFDVLYREVAHFESACREFYRPEAFFRDFGLDQKRGSVKIFQKKI